MKKVAVLVVLLFSSLILHLHLTAAHTTADTSDALPPIKSLRCEYQGKRDLPNKFQKTSITKDNIRQCLYNGETIRNHHVIFEDLVEAWKAAISLKAQESLNKRGVESPTEGQIEQEKKWDLPIKLEGGILHADRGIHLYNFRDPTATDTSIITEEKQKAFGIEKKNTPIVIIQSEIRWKGVSIDSAVIVSRELTSCIEDMPHATFRKETKFCYSIFKGGTDFSYSVFKGGTDFSHSIFKGRADFSYSIFEGKTYLNPSIFEEETYFSPSIFEGKTYFNSSTFELMFKGFQTTHAEF